MVHNLEILIISESQTLLDAIEQKVPAKLDGRMWADEYTVVQGVFPTLPSEPSEIRGKKFVRVRIHFNETADRQAIMNWMKTKVQSVLGKILKGSEITYHECDHKTRGDGCGPTKVLWSK